MFTSNGRFVNLLPFTNQMRIGSNLSICEKTGEFEKHTMDYIYEGPTLKLF